MASNERQCPICKLGNAPIAVSAGRDVYEIECKRCGKFLMEGILVRIMQNGQVDKDDEHLLPYLSAHTRQATESGILSEIHRDNWQDLARAHTTTPVPLKVTKLLDLIAAHSPWPGYQAIINADLDYPLMDASSGKEVSYLLKHLVDLDYLEADREGYIVTVKGWERLEPAVGGGGIPGRCFIAMSFDPSLNNAYELGIKSAVIDCGFDPIRIDRVHHNEKICDKILAEVRLAQFVVADFTYHRGGVYFEVGFAMGLGRPVIWTCRKDDFDNTHFDTRQYNHIVWSTPEDLKAKLTERIRATILR